MQVGQPLDGLDTTTSASSPIASTSAQVCTKLAQLRSMPEAAVAALSCRTDWAGQAGVVSGGACDVRSPEG
jgi:hypothetical protein